jgi:hypothetical protein
LAQFTLYAVYRVPAGFGYPGESFAEIGFPTEYVAIISTPAVGSEDAATQVLINHGRITGTVFSCALPPAQYVEQLGLTDALLPPPAAP